MHRFALRILWACALAGSIASLVACGGSKNGASQDAAEPPTMSADIAAFAKAPSAATWEPVHADVLQAPLAPEQESRIVDVLAANDVPRPVLNAAAVDLATKDWAGTMRWIREFSLASNSDASPDGARRVRRLATVAWLMLALRANYSDDTVDLSRLDLRDRSAFVGQSMNLTKVDFSGSQLSGGTWRNSNLTLALFVDAAVDGMLRCVGCSWESLHARGTATLTGGQWVAR